MIIGLGSDLIDIRRIEKTLERYGERFIERVYTDVERRKSEGRKQRAASPAAARRAASRAGASGARSRTASQ